jgi:hypothetical protein
MASSRLTPRPGHPKKNSTTGRLAREKRRDVPKVVRIGTPAFDSAWRVKTTQWIRPLLRAVRT